MRASTRPEASRLKAGQDVRIAGVPVGSVKKVKLNPDNSVDVKFDVNDFTQQLRRLSAIMAWAAQRQKAVQIVDLTVARGVPVTFVN